MKKLEITITAPNVDIIAKILRKINKKLRDYPDTKMVVAYEDDSVKKQIEKNEINGPKDQ